MEGGIGMGVDWQRTELAEASTQMGTGREIGMDPEGQEEELMMDPEGQEEESTMDLEEQKEELMMDPEGQKGGLMMDPEGQKWAKENERPSQGHGTFRDFGARLEF